MAINTLDDKTVDVLQDLLSINIDSQKGFEEAAENTTDPELRTIFQDFSQRRAHNAAELRQAINNADREPATHGSVSGAIHRWWIDAKQALSGKDAVSVLNEAERGEDSIRDEYENAMEKLTDPAAHNLVNGQFRNVVEGHDKVKALRDSFRIRNARD